MIAQQLFSYRQLSRLRKSATTAGLSHRHSKLRRMALTVEQMFYGVWCHSTLRTNIWYAAGDAGLVTVQKRTVTRTQLGESGTDWPRQQTHRLLPLRSTGSSPITLSYMIRMVCLFLDHTGRIWCAETGSCILQYVGHGGSVNSIRFHPTQDVVVTSSGDQKVHLWKAQFTALHQELLVCGILYYVHWDIA